jgi:hypothetical protein
MSQLEFVKPSQDPTLNILLYGPPKSGKTVGAATAPGPILYLNADRPNATVFAHSADFTSELKEVRVESLDTLINTISYLQEEGIGAGDDAIKTVVVDPIGEVYRLVLEGLSGRALNAPINLYKDTGTHLERFCRALCDLPVNVVFILHELRSKDEESGHHERLPYTGTNSTVLAAKLMAMVDVIGYTAVVTEEGKGHRYLAQLLDGKGRRGGDRFGALGTVRDVNISEWVELARKATAKEQ